MARLPIWKFFHAGAKQNQSHARAFCLVCIAQSRPDSATYSVEHYMGINIDTDKDED